MLIQKGPGWVAQGLKGYLTWAQSVFIEQISEVFVHQHKNVNNLILLKQHSILIEKWSWLTKPVPSGTPKVIYVDVAWISSSSHNSYIKILTQKWLMALGSGASRNCLGYKDKFSHECGRLNQDTIEEYIIYAHQYHRVLCFLFALWRFAHLDS